MESWDPTSQMYTYGQISSAKSNGSIDHLGNTSQRDSAYGSFSTTSSTPDHTLSNVDAASTENVLYKVSNWDAPKQGNGKAASFLTDNGGLEEKSRSFPPPLQYETNKSPRLEDHSDSKNSGSGRSNFGPVWYVPEKKTSPSPPPPPPPPPLRSDSFAATKGHERAFIPVYSEGIQTTQLFEVPHKLQACNDWSPETSEHQKQAVRAVERASEGRRGSNPAYRPDTSLEHGLSSSGDKINNNAGNANPLQLSLSSTDVRFAPATHGHQRHHHQRQYSDEITFLHNVRVSVSPKGQRHFSPSAGIQERPSDKLSFNPTQARMTNSVTAAASDINSEEKMDNSGPSRHYCVTVKQPVQGNPRPLQLKEEFWNPVIRTPVSSGLYENPVVAPVTQSPKYYLPQQPVESSLDEREKSNHYVVNKGEDIRAGVMEDCKKISCPERTGQNMQLKGKHNSYNEEDYAQECTLTSVRKTSPKDFKWSQEENHKISPQKTPMLHSLAQEGKNQSEKDAETGINRQLEFDAHLSKNARRSDRFATTLRNEIQMRRAKLQKSKSTAALAESADPEESVENWKPDSIEKLSPLSENSFSNVYKDHLKEAQARVLRATSFQRRDLEPSSADQLLERKTNTYNSSLLALVSEDKSGYLDAMHSSNHSLSVSNTHHISRIGARKRFTAEQKLKSYSEPEKMNEVGMSAGNYRLHRGPTTSEEVLGSFADRWKFFEETSSKPVCQKSVQRRTPYGRPEVQSAVLHNNSDKGHTEGSWCEKRTRAASFGVENMLGIYDRAKESDHYNGHKAKSGQSHRLETFAEYQASWKEQRKPLETRNSGRYHSADNILDAGHDQLEKPQYTHERSRSSPSTDFYKEVFKKKLKCDLYNWACLKTTMKLQNKDKCVGKKWYEPVVVGEAQTEKENEEMTPLTLFIYKESGAGSKILSEEREKRMEPIVLRTGTVVWLMGLCLFSVNCEQ